MALGMYMCRRIKLKAEDKELPPSGMKSATGQFGDRILPSAGELSTCLFWVYQWGIDVKIYSQGGAKTIAVCDVVSNCLISVQLQNLCFMQSYNKNYDGCTDT